MGVVREDERGPWIDFGEQSDGGSALRPVSPTRFRVGDVVDHRHFGGSTLHGVDKGGGGHGEYRECWISAPAEKSVYEKRCAGKERNVGYDYSWAHYVRDVALFHRGNPNYDGQAPYQKPSKLKAGRAAYMASVGSTMGVMQIKGELAAEGAALVGAVRALWEAQKLSQSAGEGIIPRAPSLRM